MPDNIKPFFHEQTKEKIAEIFASGITYGEFMQQYAQPSWCTYPEALAGRMGCNSLMMKPETISHDFCKTCECAEHYAEPKPNEN